MSSFVFNRRNKFIQVCLATPMAAHVWEKEDGNPYYSAFNTEQEPASLSSKKYG